MRLWTAAAVFVVLGGVGFLPLFGGPGYEQSLASGLVVPAAAAIATALEVSASAPSPIAGVGRGLANGALFAAVALLTALLHGARAGICDFWGGTTFFVLTAGMGALVGGAWGAVAGELASGARRRRLRAVLLALAGPIAGIVVSVVRFYGSPMIFSYDPFFGYFSGTLYDTVIDVRTELWTYRAGSVATLAGLALVASALERGPSAPSRPARLRLRALRAEPATLARFAAGCAALAASLAVTLAGPALGHWQTSATIATELGGRASGPRCDVVYPDGLFPYQVELLVRDCEEELAADEARLGAHLGGRVTAFVFADADQKRRLMGAAETQIAKPWRREVYVQFASYPHPVLGHEIAHVVAGSFAPGPFHVGGGLVPNPGLIEGVAVATSPDDDELTDAQWARAMLDLGTLPEVRTLFSLAFLGVSAGKSYTVAGAFVGWVMDRWGPDVIRAWYGGGSIEALTGQSWAALDARFREGLRALPMPAEAMAYARARFERPSVWGRRCPHVVDALNRDGDRCQGEHRYDRADGLYERALARDPHDLHATFARARIALQSPAPEDSERGRAALARLAADEAAPRTWRDRAEEAIADADLVRGAPGDAARAAAAYHDIAGRTLDEDAARTLEVKAIAAEDPAARGPIVDLLLAEPGRAQDSWLGALSLGRWSESGGDMLARYLVGRNLTQHDRWGRAAPLLDAVIAGPAPTARVAREAIRQRVVGACVLRDRDVLARMQRGLAAGGEDSAAGGKAFGAYAASSGRRDALLRLIARCTN